MSDFRATAHLQEQLGETRWAALIDPANTGKIKDLCDKLVAAAIPTEITVGGVVYEVLPILRGDEQSVKGDVMVARAKEANAHLGEKDGRNLLDNWRDIPAVLDTIAFVFTDWPRPGNPGNVTFVCRSDGRWVRGWGWLGGGWDGSCRVLRRKSPA